jgi:putative transposase
MRRRYTIIIKKNSLKNQTPTLAPVRNSEMEYNEVYFWTATIVNWKKLLEPDNYKKIVIESLKTLCERQKIAVYGFVIMPNHVHFIWELLEMNGKESPKLSFLKFTAHEFLKDLKVNHPAVLEIFAVNQNNRKHQFWQRDALAVELLDKKMFEQKLNYIHYNPLQERWNLADRPEKYLWSSANFYEKCIDDFGFITHYEKRF